MKSLNIALDFDGTYSEDPEGWGEWIALFKARGHKIYIVTMRFDHPEEHIPHFVRSIVDGIYYTEREAKRAFMVEQGISIDIWIDDRPEAVHMHAEQAFGRSFNRGEGTN